MRCLFVLFALLAHIAAFAQGSAATPRLNTARIEQLTGVKGTVIEREGVFKVSAPRADLNVRAGSVRMTPGLGLTSWAAFTAAGSATMVMGDMVLLEHQVNRVMSAALDNGLEVTALHNHFFFDSPKVMFMHIGGHGEEAKLAEAVGKVFAAIKDTTAHNQQQASAAIDPAKSTLNSRKLDAIFASTGELKDGVYKITFGRTTRMHGHAIGNAMGVNTWAAFAGSDEHAVVDGDFAVLESELQAVLKSLRSGNIDVVAIHNHMTGESPRMVFLHYWAVGPTEQLARTLRNTLDLIAR